MAESAYPRNAWGMLELALTDTPVAALLGPRQSGKSTLVRTLAPERAYVTLDDEPVLRTARNASNANRILPSAMGATPQLLPKGVPVGRGEGCLVA